MPNLNKVIIFDFDGTLADSAPIIRKIYTEMAQKHGWPALSDNDYAELRRGSLRDAQRWVGIRWWQLPLLVRSAKRLMQLESQRVELFPGVVDLIHLLHNNGFKLYVLSRNLAGTIEHVLERYDLKDELQIMSRRKRTFGSKASAIQSLVKANGYDKKDVWMIGDEVRDVEAAHKARVTSVAVGWGLQDSSILALHKPTYLVSTVEQLEKILL